MPLKSMILRFILGVLPIIPALGAVPSVAATAWTQSGGEGVVLDCTAGTPDLAAIRARVSVSRGPEFGDRACVAFFDADGSRFYRRLAVVSAFYPGQVSLELYGLRSDGGWTELTPDPFEYDPDRDRLDVVRDRRVEMPTVHVSRGGSRVVFIFDPDQGLYWAVRAE